MSRKRIKVPATEKILPEMAGHLTVLQQNLTLANILENLPVPFFMVGPDLVVTYMNERLERLTGYSSKEVVGRMTCAQVLNTEQCGTSHCVLRQVMEQGNPLPELHGVVRHRNGQEIPVTVSAFSITDPSGKVIGGFEALWDLTPIIEAEEKINLLAEYSREGLLMADENQRVVYLNTPMATILLQSKEEVIGKHLGEILPPRHVRMALELTNRLKRGQESQSRFCSMLDLPYQGQDPGSLRLVWPCPVWEPRSSPSFICGISPIGSGSSGNSRKPTFFSITSSRIRWTA